MIIYTNNRTTRTPPLAHEAISATYSSMQTQGSLQADEWEKLGVNRNDASAQQSLIGIFQSIFNHRVSLTENTVADRGGVFTVQIADPDKVTTIGFFKLGRFRAATELLARDIAHRLGLANYVVPGMFCAVKGFKVPSLTEEEEEQQAPIAELLWNGKMKVYLPDQKTDNAVLGILEPKITGNEASIYDFFCITLIMCVLGGRDIKKDGIIGSTVVDAEDILPLWIDPPLDAKKARSALDLQFLANDPRAVLGISEEERKIIHTIVEQWDIDQIINELRDRKILYADCIAEDNNSCKREFFDEGSNRVINEKQFYKHPINGNFDRWKKNTQKNLLSDDQLEALRTRMTRAKEYIRNASIAGTPMIALDLMLAVDLYAKDAAERILNDPELSTLSRKYWFEGSPLTTAASNDLTIGSPINTSRSSLNYNPGASSAELRELTRSPYSHLNRAGSVSV